MPEPSPQESKDKKADDFAPFRPLGEIVCEIATPQNNAVLWGPSQQVLRGRWGKGNLIGVTMHQVMSQMPDLPGIHLLIDCRRRTTKVFDPLALPEYADVLRIAQKVHKDAFRSDAGPMRESARENLSCHEMKTWLYWLRRGLDAKHIRTVSGTVPEMDRIVALPGKTGMELFNSSARAIKFREDREMLERNRTHELLSGRRAEDGDE